MICNHQKLLTDETLNPDKFNDFKDEQSWNSLLILSSNEVLKFDKSIDFKE